MSVSANNEKPQPAVPKGSQKPGPEGWIRPAQKRNNKSFKIRPLLNPPSYAELGCALPAPTQKQRDFLKSHCLSKPARSIDVYHTFTHSLLSQWDHLLSREHFPVSMWTRDQTYTWHTDALKQFGIFFSLLHCKWSLVISKLALQTYPCSKGNVKRMWIAPMCPSNIPTASPKGAAWSWFFGRFQTGDLRLDSLNSPCMWN